MGFEEAAHARGLTVLTPVHDTGHAEIHHTNIHKNEAGGVAQ